MGTEMFVMRIETFMGQSFDGHFDNCHERFDSNALFSLAPYHAEFFVKHICNVQENQLIGNPQCDKLEVQACFWTNFFAFIVPLSCANFPFPLQAKSTGCFANFHSNFVKNVQFHVLHDSSTCVVFGHA